MRIDLISKYQDSESYWLVADTKKEARLLAGFMKTFDSMFQGKRSRFSKPGMKIDLVGTVGLIAAKQKEDSFDRLEIHFSIP